MIQGGGIVGKQLLRYGLAGLALAGVVSLTACGGTAQAEQPPATEAAQATTEAAQGTTTAATGCDVTFADSVESGLPTSYPTPEPKELTIGLLVPLAASQIVTDIYDAAKAQIEELGGEWIEFDAKATPDLQVSQFEQLLNMDVDAIVVTPITATGLQPLLERAAEAGIPVVANDADPSSNAPPPGFATQVLQQTDQLVYLQVKAACEALPAGSKVALIGYAVPVPIFLFAAERRLYWAEQFGLEVVDSADSPNDQAEGGEQTAAGLIAKHPDLAGILGFIDEAAIGAAVAARASGREDLKTFGITALELGRGAIESGRLDASVALDTEDYGRKMAQAAYAAAEGLEIPPSVLAGEPYIVTEDNVTSAP